MLVENEAPIVQRTEIETCSIGGIWKDLTGLHTTNRNMVYMAWNKNTKIQQMIGLKVLLIWRHDTILIDFAKPQWQPKQQMYWLYSDF